MSIACVSGYFDPIHIGHIEYFKLAKQGADKLMVIVNNDEQATLKRADLLCLRMKELRLFKSLNVLTLWLNRLTLTEQCVRL